MVEKPRTLIIGDAELNCDCEKLGLGDLNIGHVGFSMAVLDQFDLILYDGKKGTKILKSKYTKTVIVGN